MSQECLATDSNTAPHEGRVVSVSVVRQLCLGASSYKWINLVISQDDISNIPGGVRPSSKITAETSHPSAVSQRVFRRSADM